MGNVFKKQDEEVDARNRSQSPSLSKMGEYNFEDADLVYQKAVKRQNMKSFGKQEFGKTFTPSLYRDSPQKNMLVRIPEKSPLRDQNSPDR